MATKSDIDKGAEATVTQCVFLNMRCIAKRRLPKHYRNHLLDARLRRERTKIEARAMHRAKENGTRCPLVLNADLEKCEVIETELPGVELVEYLKKNSKNSKKTIEVLHEAGRQMAKLHVAGLSHGDSTTSNFMVDKSEVYVFDFGLSQFNASIEEQAMDLLLFSKSVSPLEFKFFLAGYASQRGEPTAKKLLGTVSEIQSRARYVER